MYAGKTALITGSTSEYREFDAALRRSVAQIAPRYFYDERGSVLFEQITRLPEYYLTRVERDIMASQNRAISAAAGVGGAVIEPGAGNCDKAITLCAMLAPTCFIAIDIASESLAVGTEKLRRTFPHLDIRALEADLSHGFCLPVDIPRARRLVFYPGSSIGNFDLLQALSFLTRMRQLLGDDGALLIGVDLLKDPEVLEAAYNDTAGVTAAFNLNLLHHVNQRFNCDFDPGEWRHVAFFNTAASRIEMHLEARTDTTVHWFRGERCFRRGERIHTENSYKYRIENFVALLARAGFSRARVWRDELDWYALMLARP